MLIHKVNKLVFLDKKPNISIMYTKIFPRERNERLEPAKARKQTFVLFFMSPAGVLQKLIRKM